MMRESLTSVKDKLKKSRNLIGATGRDRIREQVNKSCSPRGGVHSHKCSRNPFSNDSPREDYHERYTLNNMNDNPNIEEYNGLYPHTSHSTLLNKTIPHFHSTQKPSNTIYTQKNNRQKLWDMESDTEIEKETNLEKNKLNNNKLNKQRLREKYKPKQKQKKERELELDSELNNKQQNSFCGIFIPFLMFFYGFLFVC